MAVIKSGNGGTDELQVDASSKAARVTLYTISGQPVGGAANTQSSADGTLAAAGQSSLVGLEYNVTSLTIGDGNQAAFQSDIHGNLKVTVVNDLALNTISGVVSVLNLPSIQPVSGSVTANIGTTNGLALDATQTNGTQKTQITNFPTTQQVTGTVSAIIASGLYTITGHASIDNFPSVQAISGTVTSNIGLTNGVSLDTTLTSGAQKTQVTNLPAIQQVTGTVNAIIASGLYTTSGHVTVDNFPALTAVTVSNFPSTQDVRIVNDTALNTVSGVVTVLNPVTSVAVSNFPGTQPVSGSVTVLNPTTAVSVSNLPAVQQVAGTVNAIIASGTYTIQGSVSVSNLPATQTVAGTVVANVGTTNGLALDNTLTSGSQKTQVSNFPSISTITGNVGIPSGVNINNYPATQQVAGTVAVSNFPGTQPISGSVAVSNLPTIQQVAGTVNAIIASGVYVENITQIGGSAITLGQKTGVASLPMVIASDQSSLPVTVGNFPATQPVSGTVSVGNFPASQVVTGTVSSNPLDGAKATYSASIVNLLVAALATDVFTITGNASKVVRVTRVTVTASQTTSGQVNLILLKRSTANTAGTSTSPTIVPHDSLNAASTSVIRAYTANPTAGTLVGNLKTRKVFIGATTGNSDECIWDFGTRPAQALVLRGVNESIAINLNGVTVTAGSFNIAIEWTEE